MEEDIEGKTVTEVPWSFQAAAGEPEGESTRLPRAG